MLLVEKSSQSWEPSRASVEHPFVSFLWSIQCGEFGGVGYFEKAEKFRTVQRLPGVIIGEVRSQEVRKGRKDGRVGLILSTG